MRDGLSPPCVTQKNGRSPQDFMGFFFRVTHDRLSERGTTGSLIFPPFVALAEQLPPVLTDAKHFSGSG